MKNSNTEFKILVEGLEATEKVDKIWESLA
jgi:hypothetical protein